MKKDPFSTNSPSAKPDSASQKPSEPKKRGRPPLSWPWALGLFLALLVLPVWAVVHLGQRVDGRVIATYLALISSLTFYFYWSDKRKAQQDQWRIPEGTLHLLELLGGWPAGLLAQRFLRHKTKKRTYQAVFWLIVLLHQILALEIVSHWWLTRSIWQAVSGANS